MDKTLWQTIQREQAKWSLRNFGEQPASIPLLGMIEELGELVGVSDPVEVIDAVGDVMIYMANYCSVRGLDLSELVVGISPDSDKGFRDLLCDLGRLCHAYIKTTQGIRCAEPLGEQEHRSLREIITFVRSRLHDDDSFELAVSETWARVKQRNWVQNPETGS